MFANDTICAPATSRGGAVSIVRVSGSDCFRIVDAVVEFRHADAGSARGFSIKFGVVPGLDEVLVSVFRAPHSYTGEDMAEISCHASPFVVSELLRLLCEAGCRPAEAGEFTRRAFVAGKMDLAQAEAVADIIAADSEAAHRMAFAQLRGVYSRKLQSLRAQIIELSALLELELDFSEEDVEFADRVRLESLARETLAECRRLADSFRLGNAFKKGIPVAIVGAVNSGKSTLLNALLGEDRALVSDVPGTTRDTVEEVLSVNGVNYRFIDTAGLRDTEEIVEQMGIERSYSQMDKAAVVICLLDRTVPAEALRETVGLVRKHLREDCRVLWVLSKSDLPGRGPAPEALAEELGLSGLLEISARDGLGLDKLKEALSRDDAALLNASDGVLVSNARHQAALSDAAEALTRFLQGLASGLGTELLAEELRTATASLGRIFGEVSHRELTDLIFSRFCIGK